MSKPTPDNWVMGPDAKVVRVDQFALRALIRLFLDSPVKFTTDGTERSCLVHILEQAEIPVLSSGTMAVVETQGFWSDEEDQSHFRLAFPTGVDDYPVRKPDLRSEMFQDAAHNQGFDCGEDDCEECAETHALERL